MDAEDFDNEFKDLRKKRISGRNQRKAMFGTAKMSEYMDSLEKKDDEFAFDYKEMIEELNRRQEDKKDPQKQVKLLHDELVQKNLRKHGKKLQIPLTPQESQHEPNSTTTKTPSQNLRQHSPI